MSEDKKPELRTETMAEQLQAGHRSRMNMDNVLFYEVQPDAAYLSEHLSEQKLEVKSAKEEGKEEAMRSTDTTIPDSYLNYAAQLLEQMRGVYSTSWDSCSNGSTWHGGHNHFYNPCSGADVIPPNHNCPVYDCTNQCGCNTTPQSISNYPSNCGSSAATTTYYDECAYHLQKMTDQLNRIEAMLGEMYGSNQQLFSYLIEYYNEAIGKSK